MTVRIKCRSVVIILLISLERCHLFIELLNITVIIQGLGTYHRACRPAFVRSFLDYSKHLRTPSVAIHQCSVFT